MKDTIKKILFEKGMFMILSSLLDEAKSFNEIFHSCHVNGESCLAENTLSDKLKKLEELGLITKKRLLKRKNNAYTSYSMTKKGFGMIFNQIKSFFQKKIIESLSESQLINKEFLDPEKFFPSYFT